MFIQSVRVKNFRSLVDVDISFEAYTAIVGPNDSGKSNLLRALNLFFNGQTDIGQPLVFDRDFSQLAKQVIKKARQIEIEVVFSPPTNYADGVPVCWRKIYRRDSLQPFTEDFFRIDLEQFSKGSRVDYWVRHIAFEYVPAIRGKSFFRSLKRRLYESLASTVAPKLQSASSGFLTGLLNELKEIEVASSELLKLTTEFSLPDDLGSFFEALDFDSADSFAKTSLDLRGHGIQGRHVPIILKFLADQRKFNSAKGKPSSETIWGFEEPENNLELSKQIELAQEFSDYSKSMQVLITTHSPAFYSTAKSEGGIQVASRASGKTEFTTGLDITKVDAELGLMSFIEPYLAQAVIERDAVMEQLRGLKLEALVKDRPALYVEGSTDKIVIDAVLSVKKITGGAKFDVLAKEGLGGGVNWVIGCCIARAALHELTYKTAALFDADLAGLDGIKLLKSRLSAIDRSEKIHLFHLAVTNADDEVRKIKKCGIRISLTLEEMCGIDAWRYAEDKGWLVARSEELMALNYEKLVVDKTLSELISEKITDQSLKLIILNKISPIHKAKFASHVATTIRDTEIIPASLDAVMETIAAYFR